MYTGEDLSQRPEVRGLPIAQQLVRRLQSVTDENNDYDADDAISPIVAAIVELERELRRDKTADAQTMVGGGL